MRVLAVFVLALCACAHALNLNEHDERVPMDEKLRSLLEVRQLHFHHEKESVELDADPMIGDRNMIVDVILAALEDIRQAIINGNGDPLRIPHLGPLDLTAPAVRITADMYEVDLEGLRWFVADSVTFNTIRLALGFHITLPRLIISGNYEGEARLAILIRHTAGGAFRIFVNRIEVGTELRLGTSLIGGHLILRELDIVLDIHDTHVFFEGLIGNGWVNVIFNSIVQSISQEVIQNELDNINQAINDTLFDVINEILRNFTLEDILG